MSLRRTFISKAGLWLLMLSAFAGVPFRAAVAADPGANTAAGGGKFAPDFLLEGLDGRQARINPAELKKTLVVYLFSAKESGWEEELASLDRLYNAYKTRPDFAVAALLLGQTSASGKVAAYAAARDIRFPVGRDVDNAWWTFFPGAVPRLVLTGADGKIARAYFEKLSAGNYGRAASDVEALIRNRKELLALRDKELREEALLKELPGPAAWTMETAVLRKEREELAKKVKSITPEELKEWLDAKKKFSLLFVGDAQAYAKKHIPGAVLKSYDIFSSSSALDALIGGLSREEPVVFYCGCPADTPGADLNTAMQLVKKGLGNVYTLKRHFPGWEEKGFPVEGTEVEQFRGRTYE